MKMEELMELYTKDVIELFEEWEDDTIRLAYKDLMDDGTVEEVYGE